MAITFNRRGRAGYFVAALILTLRGLGRLRHVELWAEDGICFLRDALNYGWGSWGMPADATPQILQRFITLTGFSILPISWMPIYMACSALVVQALILGHFSRSQYKWLIENDTSRLLVVAALCFIPGLTEMLMNLGNINWFLFFGVCLFFLKDPRENFSIAGMVLIAIFLFSFGTGALLIPLWAWRVWTRRKQLSKLDWLAGALLAAHMVFLSLIKSKAFFEIPHEPIETWFKTYWRVCLESFFLQPWVGDTATISLFAPGNGVLATTIGAAVVSLFLYFIWLGRKNPRTLGMFVFFLTISIWPVLCWVGRPGSMETFKNATPSVWYFSHRYSFAIAYSAVIVWCVLIEQFTRQSKKLQQVGCAAFCLIVILHSYGRFRIRAYGPEFYWRETAPLLESAVKTGCPEKVRVKIYPERLSFDYEVPENKRSASCRSPKI